MRDISGQRFGRLVATTFAGVVNKRTLWVCKCDCGNTKIKRQYDLTSGTVLSCGCLQGYTGKHGMKDTPTWHSWKGMLTRVKWAHKFEKFRRYRGITVCDRWQSFVHFFEDMGIKPEGLSLDRIDGSKGYEPSNCRWATRKEQSLNRYCNVFLTAHGKTQPVSLWAEDYGINISTLRRRLKAGMPLEDALTVPVGQARKIIAAIRAQQERN